MSKPFSIQSPENIAMEYGGNKQKIAQAMQLGVVDPTAGVLAGMFIDRMRSAQMQEQAPQSTVAQQVMGGAPPAPPTAPAGGLGATPQAAPPMAPQMGMPPEAVMAPPQEAMPEEAPMGMAEGGMVPPYAAGGGLSDVPVPDGMFDEPSNGGFGDGYAGGGLVAFAGGGDADLARFRRAIIQQESGGRFGVANTEGSGAMGLGQIMPDTARALSKRLGLPYRPDLLAGKSKEAQDYQIALTNAATEEAWNYGGGDPSKAAAYYFAGPDKSKWGEKTRKYQSDILSKLGKDVNIAERDLNTAEGQIATTEDFYNRFEKRFGRSEKEKEARAKMLARAEEMASDEEYEKNRKGDMWQTLAEIGFNMASSKSPYLLQAVGEAAAAAMPGARADKKERKAIKDKGLDLMVQLGADDRKEAQQLWGLAVEAAKTNLMQKQYAEKMGMDREELALRVQQAADTAAYQQGTLANQTAQIEAGKTQLQQFANALYEQYKAQNDQLKYRGRNGLLVGYKVADAEIRARAFEDAAKALKSSQGTSWQDFTGEGGGGNTKAAGPWTQYQQ